MLMFTLAISCLTTSNLPWFMDLTFQVPMQYCSLQHRTLLLSPVPSTTGCCFCFGSIPSFFLELFLHWSPVASLNVLLKHCEFPWKCGRQNSGLLICLRPDPKTYEYAMLYNNKVFVDAINLKIFWWESILVYTGGSLVVIRVLIWGTGIWESK